MGPPLSRMRLANPKSGDALSGRHGALVVFKIGFSKNSAKNFQVFEAVIIKCRLCSECDNADEITLWGRGFSPCDMS
jgi:hypothetical protein